MKALKKDISFVEKGMVELKRPLEDCLWSNESTYKSLLKEKRKELAKLKVRLQRYEKLKPCVRGLFRQG